MLKPWHQDLCHSRLCKRLNCTFEILSFIFVTLMHTITNIKTYHSNFIIILISSNFTLWSIPQVRSLYIGKSAAVFSFDKLSNLYLATYTYSKMHGHYDSSQVLILTTNNYAICSTLIPTRCPTYHINTTHLHSLYWHWSVLLNLATLDHTPLTSQGRS